MLPSISPSLALLIGLVSALPQDFTDPTPSETIPVPTENPVGNPGTSAACNNYPELCERAYNAVTFMGAHNSAFLRGTDADSESLGGGLGGNQFFDAVAALDAGLRLLQAQVHIESGDLVLCHTSCDISDAGPLATWLGTVGGWMDDNPNEVVTIILVNADDAPASQFGGAFESSGISKYAFTPRAAEATGDWPTLGEMITSGTRLVSFIASIDPDPAYPYLMHEFDYVFETDFEVVDSTGFNCTIDRPRNLDSSTEAVGLNYLGMVNHFKQQSFGAGIFVPDISEIDRTNSPDTGTTGSLGRHVAQCANEWGIKPQFVLVDFWNEGPAIQVADEINGLTGATGRTDPGEVDDLEDAGGRVAVWREGVVALVAIIGLWVMA